MQFSTNWHPLGLFSFQQYLLQLSR